MSAQALVEAAAERIKEQRGNPVNYDLFAQDAMILANAVLAAADAQPPTVQGAWQPIETAPKDETRVLIYRPGFAEAVCVAWWSQNWKCWRSVPGQHGWHPTHWQPLPAPPPGDEP